MFYDIKFSKKNEKYVLQICKLYSSPSTMELFKRSFTLITNDEDKDK